MHLQAPVLVQQTYLQQIMAQVLPYLVLLIIAALTGLAAIVKSYVAKLIAQLEANKTAAADSAQATIDQLKANKAAADDAAINAQAAATLAAGASIAVATHNQQAMAKLDTVVSQTNGINEALGKKITSQNETIAAQAQEISDLKPPVA